MSRLTLLAFPINGYASRQRRFDFRVFLLLVKPPTKEDESQLPDAAGFMAPETRVTLSPVS
ncbi:hypothetical protein DPMN_193132 [Dreissena polymorpha]|uniref:Uncharacterized protein n=1 Tax=Dreissena polymorpha TaxID=45954 RepID=A0A9D3Y6B9_DREPO|nr:hypothetical protein DPMN_193132 [Dreissena polymorpha]